MVDALPPLLRRQVHLYHRTTDDYFGFFWAVVGYPWGHEFENMTLAEAADLELKALETIFAHALPSQRLLLT